MRFINILSVFIVRKLPSLSDVRVVYRGVVVMSLEVVFRRDVIRNTPTLAMSGHYEIVFPILLDNPVGLFLSRFSLETCASNHLLSVRLRASP